MRLKFLIYFFAILFLFGCGKKKQETLIDYSSDAGRFSVQMPGSPKMITDSLQTAVGTVNMYIFIFEKTDISYMVAYCDYPRSAIENFDPNQLFDNARNAALRELGGSILSEKDFNFNGYSAREIKFEAKFGLVVGQIVYLLADNRFYQVMVKGWKLTYPIETVREFINSFKISSGYSLDEKDSSFDFADWEHGATGHKNALALAQQEELPLIVYFHTERCQWSKRMISEYLASHKVREFLKGIPKVEINPEKGAAEKELCNKRYGVTGYPKFLVFIPAYNNKPYNIYPFRKGRDWTIDEFTRTIGERIALEYNQKGHLFYVNKKYEDAIECHEIALGYDPENAYSYYGMGVACYAMGYYSRNLELIDKAEKHFIRALELNPDDKQSRKQLENIRKGNERMGR